MLRISGLDSPWEEELPNGAGGAEKRIVDLLMTGGAWGGAGMASAGFKGT